MADENSRPLAGANNNSKERLLKVIAEYNDECIRDKAGVDERAHARYLEATGANRKNEAAE